MTKSRFILTLCLCFFVLTGCQTIEKQVASMQEQIETAVNSYTTVQTHETKQENEKTEFIKTVKPTELTIKDTPLYKLFEKYPYYDDSTTYPRVALSMAMPRTIKTVAPKYKVTSSGTVNVGELKTIDPKDQNEFVILKGRLNNNTAKILNGCYVFEGVIWHSSTKSEKIPAFAYCLSDSTQDLKESYYNSSGAYENMLIGLHSPSFSVKNTGYRRTFGPTPPKDAIDGKKADGFNKAFNFYVLKQLILDSGYEYDKNEDFRMWIVDIKEDESL